MKIVGGIVGGLLGGPLGAAIGIAGTAGAQAALSKKPKAGAVAALPMVTRDEAAAAVARDDDLRRRKGGAADILTGATGAEAALTGGKLVLGN